MAPRVISKKAHGVQSQSDYDVHSSTGLWIYIIMNTRKTWTSGEMEIKEWEACWNYVIFS